MSKKTIDIEKFVEAKIFLYSIRDIKIKEFDFSCVFNKDLKVKDKSILSKQWGTLEELLTTFFVLKKYHLEFGVEFRDEFKKYVE